MSDRKAAEISNMFDRMRRRYGPEKETVEKLMSMRDALAQIEKLLEEYPLAYVEAIARSGKFKKTLKGCEKTGDYGPAVETVDLMLLDVDTRIMWKSKRFSQERR